MFNSIKGIYKGKTNNSIFIETHGIEWEVFTTNFALNKFNEGDEVKVYTWLQHRDDIMQLFGFAELKERLMFLDLIKVEGIGPKQAIKILSNITTSDLEIALESGDITRLQTIPGIGKKTAQKMTLALKGKLTLLDDSSTSFNTSKNAIKSEYEEVILALIEMGYDRKKCVEAVEKVANNMKMQDKEPLKNESEFFRLSIVELA